MAAARGFGIGVLLALLASAGASAASAASPSGTHHVGATLHGHGGARLRIDAQVPRGYHVVLHDPARMRGGELVMEIRRGSGLTPSGVMLIGPQGAVPAYTRRDPAYPAPPQTAQAVARSWEPQSMVRARRVLRDRYLLVRRTHPVGFVVGMDGALPSVVIGRGVGRALLEDLVRTLVARWIAPTPLGASSDPEALALRDRANAAIAVQDAYSVLFDFGHTEDVIRSARYLALYAGSDRVLQGLEIGHTGYASPSSPGGCWSTYRPFETGQYLAPRLPIAAPGLTYAPVKRVDGVARLRYRYWTSEGTPTTVQVDIDPATLLPAATRTRGEHLTWRWGPVVQVPHPRACRS